MARKPPADKPVRIGSPGRSIKTPEVKAKRGQKRPAPAAPEVLERIVCTPREILFAEQWMIDHNAGRAYRDSSDKPITKQSAYVRGCKTLALPRVRAYIEKVEAKLAEHSAVTKAWTVLQGTRVYTEAMARGQFGSATQALQLLARLNGLIVEPTKVVRLINSMADLSQEELEKLAAGIDVDAVALADDAGETRH
jgi:hypothetical protein